MVRTPLLVSIVLVNFANLEPICCNDKTLFLVVLRTLNFLARKVFLVVRLRLNVPIFYFKNKLAHILFDHKNLGNPAVYGGLVKIGDVWVPFERVAIACKNNDFGLEPRETALIAPRKG